MSRCAIAAIGLVAQNDDPGKARTCNPRRRRPMPYQLGHGAARSPAALHPIATPCKPTACEAMSALARQPQRHQQALTVQASIAQLVRACKC